MLTSLNEFRVCRRHSQMETENGAAATATLNQTHSNSAASRAAELDFALMWRRPILPIVCFFVSRVLHTKYLLLFQAKRIRNRFACQPKEAQRALGREMSVCFATQKTACVQRTREPRQIEAKRRGDEEKERKKHCSAEENSARCSPFARA